MVYGCWLSSFNCQRLQRGIQEFTFPPFCVVKRLLPETGTLEQDHLQKAKADRGQRESNQPGNCLITDGKSSW